MMFACIYGAGLAEIASAFSPSFEQTSNDTIVFRVDGLQRLFGTPEQIAEAIGKRANGKANVSIAETADAATLGAHNIEGVSVFPALDNLPVDALPIDQEMLETLDTWGIYTLAQLAALPETGIAERFGENGVHLQRLANGVTNRPLKIFQPDITYEDRIELDHPVSLLEPLLFLIARILNEQCEKLISNAMATNEITVTLELDDKSEHIRVLRLPVAMRESKSLLKLLQMDLEAHPPQAATMAVSLSLKPVQPRTVQSGIFLPVAPAPDKLELTLARIRGIVGENNVGIPELLDTHHPNPFRLVPHKIPELNTPPACSGQTRGLFNALRYFRPCILANVELVNNRPTCIHAPGIHGKVLTAAGPWRTSGDWWTKAAWNRDEWDIKLDNGVIYRIYTEPTNRWYVEATYD